MSDSYKAKFASKRKSSSFVETLKTVVYAVLIAIVVRTVAYEPFNIPSGSMIPTLLVGDYLFVSKFSYGYSRYSLPWGLPLFSGRIFGHDPVRGDVVVFKKPTDNTTDYIKRIIGLPGDRLQMIHGVLNINGTPVGLERTGIYVLHHGGQDILADAYTETLPNGLRHPILRFKGTDDDMMNNTPVYVVPPEHYFAMGDDRDDSADSRADVGYVPAENLVGRAEFLFFSTDGSAEWWEVWKWPFAIRYERLFHGIH
jgi:signal peptidase I